MKGAFDGATPYVAKVVARCKQKGYIQGKLPLKLMSLEILRERADELGGYTTYSDPLAGIGISARIFGGKKKRLILNDFDESCCRVLRENYKGKITSDDVLTAPMVEADMIFLDFNNLTYKRALGEYSKPLQGAMEAAGSFLVLNDCSPFYLRYGAEALKVYSKLLGQPITSIEGYFRAVALWYAKQQWYLVHVAYFSETSFMLLSKRHSKLIIRKLDKADVPRGMVTVEE